MTLIGQIFGSAVAGPLSQTIGRRHVGIAFGAVTVSYVEYYFLSFKTNLSDCWSFSTICCDWQRGIVGWEGGQWNHNRRSLISGHNLRFRGGTKSLMYLTYLT
jgi:hypothetical protein